jgi:hypothetical protein
MANELQLLPNPDNTPGAVSSGYQRQNTNFFASTVGLDLLNFSKDETNNALTLYAGGIVEINGALYKIPNTVTLNLDNTKNQYVSLLPSGNNASVSLVDSPGTFDYTRNGYYSGGARIINIYLSPHFCSPYSITGTQVVKLDGAANGTYSATPGCYRYDMMGARGGKGGKGGTGGNSQTVNGRPGAEGGTGTYSVDVTGVFTLDKPCTLSVISGRDGGDGGTGGAGTDSTGAGDQAGDGGNGGIGGDGAISSIMGVNIRIISEVGKGGMGGAGGAGAFSSGQKNAVGTTGTPGFPGGKSTGAGYVYIYKIA